MLRVLVLLSLPVLIWFDWRRNLRIARRLRQLRLSLLGQVLRYPRP